jgi:hypothetical protein
MSILLAESRAKTVQHEQGKAMPTIPMGSSPHHTREQTEPSSKHHSTLPPMARRTHTARNANLKTRTNARETSHDCYGRSRHGDHPLLWDTLAEPTTLLPLPLKVITQSYAKQQPCLMELMLHRLSGPPPRHSASSPRPPPPRASTTPDNQVHTDAQSNPFCRRYDMLS